MNYLLLTLVLLFTGCATKPVYEPADNYEYIEQLQAEADLEVKSESLKLYSYVGVGLFIAGVGMIAFGKNLKAGLILMTGGGLAMGSPFVFNSEWFSWIFGTGLVLVIADGLYVLAVFTIQYIKNKKQDTNNANEQK